MFIAQQLTRTVPQLCSKIHLKSKMSRDHKVVSLLEMQEGAGGGAMLKSVPVYCTTHPLPNMLHELTLWCKTCEMAVCRDCIVDVHCKPEHDYVFIEEVAGAAKDTLRAQLQDLDHCAGTVTAAVEGIDAMQQQVAERQAESEAEVRAAYGLLRDAVEAQQARSLEELSSGFGRSTNALAAQKARVGAVVEAMEQASGVVRAALDGSTDVQVVVNKSLMSRRLRALQGHTQADFSPDATASLFLKTDQEPLRSCLGSFCTLQFPDADAGCCTATGAGLAGRPKEREAVSFVVAINNCSGTPAPQRGPLEKYLLVTALSINGSTGETHPVEVAVADDGNATATYVCSYTPPDQSPMSISVKVCGKHLPGSPFGVTPTKVLRPVQLLHTGKDFDTAGMLYYIGTKGRTVAYENPQASGLVQVSCFSAAPDYYEDYRFVQHVQDGNANYTTTQKGCYMQLALPPDARMEVNYYCLRHGHMNGARTLRNWELQGSVDGGVSWATLSEHTNDQVGRFSTTRLVLYY